jgi:hypothetical protein
MLAKAQQARWTVFLAQGVSACLCLASLAVMGPATLNGLELFELLMTCFMNLSLAVLCYYVPHRQLLRMGLVYCGLQFCGVLDVFIECHVVGQFCKAFSVSSALLITVMYPSFLPSLFLSSLPPSLFSLPSPAFTSFLHSLFPTDFHQFPSRPPRVN